MCLFYFYDKMIFNNLVKLYIDNLFFKYKNWLVKIFINVKFVFFKYGRIYKMLEYFILEISV